MDIQKGEVAIKLATRGFAVFDGQWVEFGVDLGALPEVSFAPNYSEPGLIPLASGEIYQFTCEDLTPTGFRAHLKCVDGDGRARPATKDGFAPIIATVSPLAAAQPAP